MLLLILCVARINQYKNKTKWCFLDFLISFQNEKLIQMPYSNKFSAALTTFKSTENCFLVANDFL